ncbi:MAG: pantoate--beta-alanine ligase [Gemmatimonadetes bacterium]|nr:pantoate--beta-alanine ligase [Gemmatimonadota bacterium]
MRVIETVSDMRGARRAMRSPVGLVPTMGALHGGHEALLARARDASATLVASLFVNPAQFGPGEDFQRYPRDREGDLAVFERHRVDAVFAPRVGEMYPEGEATRVDPGPIGRVLEGEHRPGHFLGVATVVAKLFAVILPDVAFFGEKDAQQLRVIRRMARDLLFGVEIVGVPTVREADGLAMSSRNRYLRGADRRAAAVLHRSLREALSLWEAGERDAEALRGRVRDTFAAAPLAELEYVSVADPDTLAELETVDRPALVSLAARVGGTRLIDNILLGGEGP